jgi:hypothetical protein
MDVIAILAERNAGRGFSGELTQVFILPFWGECPTFELYS